MCESGSPQGGGELPAFRAIIQITSLHTLPLVGRVGRASGRGGGLRMLIVSAFKPSIAWIARFPAALLSITPKP